MRRSSDMMASETVHEQKSRSLWSSGLAALMSFVVPGSGQLYGGKTIPAIIWLPAVICTYLASLPLGLAAHGICVLDATEHRTKREPLDDAPAVEVSKPGLYVFGSMVFAVALFGTMTVFAP